MKTITETRRVGELLGPVDWSYNFRQHFDNYCTSDEGKDDACAKDVERLRKIVESPDEWLVTTYGGWPRCGWGNVVAVGMYDGWPYWRPVPSVAFRTTLGVEWTAFSGITNIMRLDGSDIQ